jgi:hypothetical protein
MRKKDPDCVYGTAISVWWIWQRQIAIGLDDTGRCEAGREKFFFRVLYSFVTALAEDMTQQQLRFMSSKYRLICICQKKSS